MKEQSQALISRAKKVDGSGYAEGDYCSKTNRIYTNELLSINCTENEFGDFKFFNYMYFEVDPSTLAIHFPDMIDSEGTKIFASLSEDGKGGDILDNEKLLGEAYKVTAIFWKHGLSLLTSANTELDFDESLLKVTGIQE